MSDNALKVRRQTYQKEGHRNNLLGLAAGEMLRMDERLASCWGDFLQLVALNPADVVEYRVRDLAATQP
eukprot:14352843-Alexandrium_andersonii.AAC.1